MKEYYWFVVSNKKNAIDEIGIIEKMGYIDTDDMIYGRGISYFFGQEDYMDYMDQFCSKTHAWLARTQDVICEGTERDFADAKFMYERYLDEGPVRGITKWFMEKAGI